MAKFVEFINTDNENVAVNVELVTYVKPAAISGTFIGFGKDRGVAVDAEYPDVVAALRNA